MRGTSFIRLHGEWRISAVLPLGGTELVGMHWFVLDQATLRLGFEFGSDWLVGGNASL